MKDEYSCRYYCITGGQQLQQKKGKIIWYSFYSKIKIIWCFAIESDLQL